MPTKTKRRKRIPKIHFTTTNNLGWHVNYRDPETSKPRKFSFGNVSRSEANTRYEEWLVAHLSGKVQPPKKKMVAPDPTSESSRATVKAVPGCLLLVA